MFASRYFTRRYWAERFFPRGTAIIGPGMCPAGTSLVFGAASAAIYNGLANEAETMAHNAAQMGLHIDGVAVSITSTNNGNAALFGA